MTESLKRLKLKDAETICLPPAETRRKIGVAGLCRGAGSTFAGVFLARLLAEGKNRRVTFTEALQERGAGFRASFDALGLDRTFAGRSYRDPRRAAGEGNLPFLQNLWEGVNWALEVPGEAAVHMDGGTPRQPGAEAVLSGGGSGPRREQEGEKERLPAAPAKELLYGIRLINGLPGDTVVCDTGFLPGRWELLWDFDVILAVADPLPSALLAGQDSLLRFKQMERAGKQVLWIINKYNSGVPRRQLLDFLKVRRPVFLPFLPAADLYAAEYACMLPAGKKEIRAAAGEPFREILARIA